MRIKIIAAVVLKCFTLASLTGVAWADRPYSVPPGINVLAQSSGMVGEYVTKRYPGARTHAFEDVIHFELGTALHVLPAIAKHETPPLVAERGPLEGGVWCDIEVKAGSHDRIDLYARAAGKIDRGPFMEHLFYVAPPLEPRFHLIVTVRLPKDAGEKGEEFAAGLRKTLEKFYIERQTEDRAAE